MTIILEIEAADKSQAPEECFEVEYDLKFSGGDYSGVGDFAYVPFALLTDDVTPEEAFEQHTGHSRQHIIHFTLDEAFDRNGERLEEE